MNLKLCRKFFNKGIVQNGHFKLSSGKHSDVYCQISKLFEDPELAKEIIDDIIDSHDLDSLKIDKIVSPAMGGILPGYEMARQLGTDHCFCERVNGKFELRRGFQVFEGENIAIVEDVITTGKSYKEIIELLKPFKANIVAIGCIVDRCQYENEEIKFSYLKLNPLLFEESECELCKQNITLITPGSRFLI
jgi:orotate phosphoribosyltransferase